MINVTQSYLPDKRKYKKYIDLIYDQCQLTNNGQLLQTLEKRLQAYLGVKHVICVANGSLALQVAYKVLELKGEVITTPFSFVATSSTLMWEGLTPIFADICPRSFNINPTDIEAKITDKTSAIVPVHVFGNPCEVEKIQKIADKYKLKVIYDAAHAFGVRYKDQSILNYGDVSTLSFHATKLFHTIEGGAIITQNDEIAKKIRQLINFGLSDHSETTGLGTNAKMNEFEAAMGLCVLDEIGNIIESRQMIWEKYINELSGLVEFQCWNSHSMNLCAYASVLLPNEVAVKKLISHLKKAGVYPRRYFYPSLNTIYCLKSNEVMKVSQDISNRILCLPIYFSLSKKEQEEIIGAIIDSLK